MGKFVFLAAALLLSTDAMAQAGAGADYGRRDREIMQRYHPPSSSDPNLGNLGTYRENRRQFEEERNRYRTYQRSQGGNR